MARKTYKFHNITIPQANDPTKTISKDNYTSPTHHSEDGMIGFDAPDATLVSNVLTPVDSVVVVRGEAASADVIDHITYGAAADIADFDLLWLLKGAEAITINHNTSTPPANSGPVLLLSQVNQLMPAGRMVLLQRQGTNFQEIAFNGVVGNNGILVTDDAGQAIIVCGSVASAVNYLKVTNAATGNDVVIEPAGTDANIGLTIQGKGTGLVKILSQITTTLYDAAGKAWLKAVATASAVNEVTITNNVTTAAPKIEATGTDANIDLEINGKGTGYPKLVNLITTNIREATGKAIAIAITAIASAVNYIEVKANVTTAAPEIEAKGTDTNIGIKIITKGTGKLELPESDLANKSLDNIKNLIHDIATSGTDVDFSEEELETISITGATTFTGTNYATGKSKVIKLLDSGSGQTLAFPAGWIFVGTKPTAIAASKTAILTLTCFSGAESGVVAAYAEQT